MHLCLCKCSLAPLPFFSMMPHMPCHAMPAIHSISLLRCFSKIESMTFFLRALAQFDENKHACCGRGIRIGKGCRDNSCRRGEVEGCCRPDRSKVWSFCCLQLQREKGNANSNSMMTRRKSANRSFANAAEKDAYAHTGCKMMNFSF